MATAFDLIPGLITKIEHGHRHVERMNHYYTGKQKLSYMVPELMIELGDRIRPVIINWPRLVVDSVEERLDVEGFRYGTDAEADSDLWTIWQDNDLDEHSQQGHLEALISSRAYVIIGAGASAGDSPVITVESPEQVHACLDPRTREVTMALKWWHDDGVQYASLYLPTMTVPAKRVQGHWVADGPVDQHNMGVVPVVPLVNRPRLLHRMGESELTDVLPISDAACKIATDMMVGAEFHAVPSRGVFGMSDEDFQDPEGNKISKWKAIMGRLWTSENTSAKTFEFAASSLSNFHQTLNSLAAIASSMAALPPHYLGLTTDNPASADAIRSNEARLVKRCERKQRGFGGSWEQVMRIAVRVQTGAFDPQARQLETLWRDASTPTVAERADAAVKLSQGDRPIVPIEQVREDLGYTSVQRERMKEMDQSAADPFVAGITRVLSTPVAAANPPVPPMQPATSAPAVNR
jgi:Phage portal protein, SPP1 Gp6-like